MEHSSLDLSIVKKEPGFDEPFSSDSGLFDNMMSEDFHDTSFHSMVSVAPFIRVVVKLHQFTADDMLEADNFLPFNGDAVFFLPSTTAMKKFP